jgi:hypothetical protein
MGVSPIKGVTIVQERYYWFDERDRQWHEIDREKYLKFREYMRKYPEIALGLRLLHLGLEEQ